MTPDCPCELTVGDLCIPTGSNLWRLIAEEASLDSNNLKSAMAGTANPTLT